MFCGAECMSSAALHGVNVSVDSAAAGAAILSSNCSVAYGQKATAAAAAAAAAAVAVAVAAVATQHHHSSYKESRNCHLL